MTGNAAIPLWELSYFQGRLATLAHQAPQRVIGPLESQGSVGARALVLRVGRRRAQITAWLANPEDGRLDTMGDILLGMGWEAESVTQVNLAVRERIRCPEPARGAPPADRS